MRIHEVPGLLGSSSSNIDKDLALMYVRARVYLIKQYILQRHVFQYNDCYIEIGLCFSLTDVGRACLSTFGYEIRTVLWVGVGARWCAVYRLL
jgi:hypothetical protein